jgi:YidC/Oxa1 family membrane protein insertase
LDTLLAESVKAREAGGRRIMIAPSYQKGCIPDSCLDELIDQVVSSNPGCTVVFRPHPQYVRRFPAKMQAIAERYAKRKDVVMEADFSKPSTMDQADVLVTDWSGIAYEYAFRTKRPVVFIDTPMKVINRDWEKLGIVPTDISFRNEVGESVPLTDIPAAGKAVADMLEHPGRFAAKIENLLKTQFFNPGHAGEVAGKYILESLINRKKGTKK